MDPQDAYAGSFFLTILNYERRDEKESCASTSFETNSDISCFRKYVIANSVVKHQIKHCCNVTLAEA